MHEASRSNKLKNKKMEKTKMETPKIARNKYRTFWKFVAPIQKALTFDACYGRGCTMYVPWVVTVGALYIPRPQTVFGGTSKVLPHEQYHMAKSHNNLKYCIDKDSVFDDSGLRNTVIPNNFQPKCSTSIVARVFFKHSCL